MFTQTLKINTNKCNGCAKRCTLDAVPYNKKKGGFLPTINGKVHAYFYDKNRIKRISRKHPNRFQAIDQARTIATYCIDYNPKLSTETAPKNNPNVCTGCLLKCELGATQTEQGFMPTIQNRIIHTYINAYGIPESATPRTSFLYALTSAKCIAKRCDFYKKQAVQEKLCNTK